MLEAAGAKFFRQVGLVEDIAALVRVVVRGQRQRADSTDSATRIDVLVELVVMRDTQAVLQLHAVREFVVEHSVEAVNRRSGIALAGIAEEGARISVEWRAVERGKPAIGSAVIAQVLVTEGKRSTVAQHHGRCRIHSVALEVRAIAETIGRFGHSVQPPCYRIAQLVADIDRATELVVAAEGDTRFTNVTEHRTFGHAIDDAARTTAAEDHTAGTLQNFDALKVIEIPENLCIIANPVDEKVCRRAVTAQHDLVAVALALMHEDARNVAKDVAHALHRLVLHHLLRNHGDRCWDLLERRIGLGKGTRSGGSVARDRAIGALGLLLDRHLR